MFCLAGQCNRTNCDSAITKNGLTLLTAPKKPDVTKYKTENKITDEEVLKILERPIAKNTGSKNKKKKPKKKATKKAAEGAPEEEESDEE